MRLLIVASSLFIALSAPVNAQTPTPPTVFDTKINEARAAMMADPEAALELALAADTIAQDAVQHATVGWLRGEALNRLNRSEEAAPLLDEALATVDASASGTKLQGDLLVARAGAARLQGDYPKALQSLHRAHDVFASLGEARNQAIALQQIASIYTDAHDYQRALDYYRRAGEAYAGDPPVELSRLNNVANAHRELGDYAEAETGYRQALAIAEQMESPMLRARILANIAAVQIAQNWIREADQTARAGLRLRAEGWRPFLWGVRAQAAFASGNHWQARELIGRTFADQDLRTTTMPYRDFHRSAYEIYAAAGNDALALRHLEAFKRLDDEARDVAASANTALMGAQFDFASQELQISQLRTQSLEAEARQRTMLFFAVIVIVAIILTALVLGYLSMRRSRNQVRAANDLLQDLNQALEKALKAKSEFLATTSHEIRTPLNGILGMTQVMLLDPKVEGAVRERVEVVHGAGESMRAIVDDILDVAKMETGTLTVNSAPIDPRAALEDVCRFWRVNAEAKGLVFETDLSACNRRILADEQRLRQVMFNLLSNAVKFTQRGKIQVRTFTDGERLVVSVEDTGEGIPADQFEPIFEPFHQVNGSTTRQHSGTGLGLSICRNLSRAMDGDVTVESIVGQGSTFKFSLRLHEDALTKAAEPSGAVAIHTLVVESNPFLQCLYEACGLDDGARLADSVEAGVAVIANGGCGRVVVSSLSLGLDPASAMAALMHLREATAPAKLIVLIGDGAQLTQPAARLCGADSVIEGEINLDVIQTALDQFPTAKAA